MNRMHHRAATAVAALVPRVRVAAQRLRPLRLRARPMAVATALVALVGHSAGGDRDRVGGYDFSYEVTGDARVRPVQVFDDGRDTYFQFRAGDPVPAIFVVSTKGPVLAMPEQQGPYVRVPSVTAGYLLRMGYGIGQVKYTAPGRGSLPEQLAPVATPAAEAQAQSAVRLLAAAQRINGLPADMFNAPTPAPRLEANSYATPLRGDKVEWSGGAESQFEVGLVFPFKVTKLPANAVSRLKSVATRASRAARVEVTGRDDPTHELGTADGRAEAVAAALVAAGVPKRLITVKSTPQVKDATRTTVEGVTIVLTERTAEPAPMAVAAATAVPTTDPVGDVVRRLRAGELSPSAAADLLERARNGAAVVGAAPAAAAAPRTWAMRKTDETVERMLERWAKDANWRVVWEGAPAVPITGDAAIDRPDFLQAADAVMRSAKAAGYRLKATAHSNRVLHVTGE